MKLYRFKTYRTSYYFPEIKKGEAFLYGLYSPFGMLAKCYWFLFRRISLVRNLNSITNIEKCFPYSRLISMLPDGSKVSFNMGTPGPEQKISMLGIEPNRTRFFAKFSINDAAKKLSQNEINVLRVLHGKGITPELYDYKVDSEFVFFRTAYVEGGTLKNTVLDKSIVELAIQINQLHLTDTTNNNDLEYGLSHGDFCPWNMIIHDNTLSLIDWEMADDRPLGYDLFTFICSVSVLLESETPLIANIDRNMQYIKKYFEYFSVSDYMPYIKTFARLKYEYETCKGDSPLSRKYLELQNML